MLLRLDIGVELGAWLCRTAERRFGGSSPLVRLLLVLMGFLRLLHAWWAAWHLVRSKAAVAIGEAEWLAYADAPVDERTTILWLPGGAFISEDGFDLGAARALLPRLATRLSKVPRMLVYRYPLPARQTATTDAVAACLKGLCGGHRVILAGDSAGAFLALQTLLDREALLAADVPPRLLGCCLVCPWLDLTCSSEAHARNAHRDGIQVRLAEHGAATYLSPRGSAGAPPSLEALRAASPAHAPPHVLAALPAGGCLVVRSARDILFDDGALLARSAAAAGAPADAVALHTVDDGVWGVHCGCLLPTAAAHSAAVGAAHDAMAAHVAGLITRGS